MKHCFLQSVILFLLPIIVQAQNVTGYIYDHHSGENLPGVNIYYTEKGNMTGTVSDENGWFEIEVPSGTSTLFFRYIGYETQSYNLSLRQGEKKSLMIRLIQQSNLMDEVVVSAGRYEQRLNEITVSVELLKPAEIARQSPQDITYALRTLPGVEINDRQPTIRGGSGWTFGVGSRTLVLLDGSPIRIPGSQELNWSMIPMELIDQVEVIKGASSVLYGSSALNGLINVRTRRPSEMPETTVKTYMGIYGNPAEESYQWWDKQFQKGNNYPVTPLLRKNILSGVRNPIYDGIDLTHSRRIGNLDAVAGLNYFSDEGYREGVYKNRLRIGGNITYHDPRVAGLNYGFNANFLSEKYADFFFWRSPSEVYRQSALASMGREESVIHIDPFINWSDTERQISHRFKGRYYHRNSTSQPVSSSLSATRILEDMGFNYESLPELIDLASNWQTALLPPMLQYLPDALNGDFTGLFGEIQKLGNYYFPTAGPENYIDLATWALGKQPFPSNTAELVQWLISTPNQQKERKDARPNYITTWSAEYQFNKKFENSQMTTGVTYEHIYDDSATTGKHFSDNVGLFGQYDFRLFEKLNASAGLRLEYYRVDNHYKEAETEVLGIDLPFKPIVRAGLNYELGPYSFLRASYGQGYRYPSISEKFNKRDAGSVGVFPNSDLKAEHGYNAEIGIKQGYQWGNLKGFLDVAGFYTHYKNMIEFRFGAFDNNSAQYITGLDDLLYTMTSGGGLGLGVQFYNVDRAVIYGIDASVSGQYEFRPDTKLNFKLSYVYTEPRDVDVDKRNAMEEADNDLLAMRSKSNDSKYLKYRQKHTFKTALDFEWKRFNIGTNLTWKSKMLAVDYFIVDEREKLRPNLMDYVRGLVFGDLHDYWMEKNKSYLTMDLRMGFRLNRQVSLLGMVTNLLNTEYSVRPMDIAPPRTFILQAEFKF